MEVTTVYLYNKLEHGNQQRILAVLGKQGEVSGLTIHRYKELPHVRTGILSMKIKIWAKAAIPAYIYDMASKCTVQVH